MNAISVWDHKPTADALLDARLRAGWTPTPTSTVDGDKVLGHACRVTGDRLQTGAKRDCDGKTITYRRELEMRSDGNMHITVVDPPNSDD